MRPFDAAHMRQRTEVAALLRRMNALSMPYDITCIYDRVYTEVIDTLRGNGWRVYTFVESDPRHCRALLISGQMDLSAMRNLDPNNFIPWPCVAPHTTQQGESVH